MVSVQYERSEMLVFYIEPRVRFYTRARKFKNEVTNRRGKKGPFLNLEKTCIIMFCMRDFFLRSQADFFNQVSFCPVKRGNRAGSSRNEFDCSRSTQTSSPLLDCRSCENFEFRTSSFFIFLLDFFLDQSPSLINNCQFSDYKIEK